MTPRANPAPTKEEAEILANILARVIVADYSLEEAAKLLLKFKTEDIPSLSGNAFKMFGDKINNIDLNIHGLKSFLSVSILQQVATTIKEDQN